MTPTISPDAILKELAKLWVSLGKAGKAGETGGDGVLRACSMTLIVLADEADDPAGFGETLAALMPEHPARAIVIRVRETAEPVLTSQVVSQCWMPFGTRQQICCEQVEITASDAMLPHVPPVVLPLQVPDLPVMLWCRGARLFAMDAFPRLARMAHKVIVDSARFSDPRAVLERLSAHAGHKPVVADLAWTRLTRWRSLVAQAFENPAYLARLRTVTRVRVLAGEPSVSARAYYLAAWLSEGIRKAGGAAEVEIATGEGPEREITGIELSAAGTPVLGLRLAEGASVELRVDGVVQRTALPPRSEYQLLREELAIPARDAAFEAALPAACTLARGTR